MNAEITTPESRQLLYLNVAVSEKGLTELSGHRRVVFVPRGQIQRIEIKFGLQAERPLAQGITSAVLIVLGIVGLHLIVTGGLSTLRWALGFIVFGALGVFLLWGSLRRGHYLRVICSNDIRKLAFKGTVRRVELSSFIKSAAQFGYNFQNCLND